MFMRKMMMLICGAVLLLSTSCIKGPAASGSSEGAFVGKLVVTDMESGDVSYTDNSAEVAVVIPNITDSKLEITFKEVKFAEAMPLALNIQLKGVPFTVTVSEEENSINYIFDAKDIIPESFESKYLINRVWGCIGKSKVEISFTMESRNSQVTFTAYPGSGNNTTN